MIESLFQRMAQKNGQPPTEQTGPRGRNSQGPQIFRHMTNGQIRRAEARRAKSRRRKATKRYRRDWMRNTWNLAVLRGQLQMVARLSAEDPQRRYFEKILADQYGSVRKAQDHYLAVLQEAKS